MEKGAIFPFWLHGGSKIQLRTVDVLPHPLARIGPGTELIVSPHLRLPLPSHDSASNQFGDGVEQQWMRVQEWPPANGGETRIDSPITAFAFLPRSIFDDDTDGKAALAIGQRIRICTARSKIDPVMFGLPSSAVAPGHVGLSPHLQKLLAVESGSRVMVQPCRPYQVSFDGKLHVQLQLSPVTVIDKDVERENAGNPCSVLEGTNLTSFLRQWWARQLAAIPASGIACCDLGGLPHTALPAGIIASIEGTEGAEEIQEGPLPFLQVCLSARSGIGGIGSGLYCRGSLVAVDIMQDASAHEIPVEWMMPRLYCHTPRGSMFRLPSNQTRDTPMWLANAQSAAVQRAAPVLVAAPRAKAMKNGLPPSGLNPCQDLRNRSQTRFQTALPAGSSLDNYLFCVGGTLVVGPPGSGKTALLSSLPQAVSAHCCYPIESFYVCCSTLVGEQASHVRNQIARAATEAEEHAPSMLLLDDLDALFPSSGVRLLPPCLAARLVWQHDVDPPSQDENQPQDEEVNDPSNGLADWLAAMLDGIRSVQWESSSCVGPWPVAVVASCSSLETLATVLRAPFRLDFNVELKQPGQPLFVHILMHSRPQFTGVPTHRAIAAAHVLNNSCTDFSSLASMACASIVRDASPLSAV